MTQTLEQFGAACRHARNSGVQVAAEIHRAQQRHQATSDEVFTLHEAFLRFKEQGGFSFDEQLALSGAFNDGYDVHSSILRQM